MSNSLTWFNPSIQIRTTNDKYVVQTNGLLIRNVQESDEGIYTCRAAVIETGELLDLFKIILRIRHVELRLDCQHDQKTSVLLG